MKNLTLYEKILFNLSIVGSATAEQLTRVAESQKQGRDSLNLCIKKGYVESIPFGHEKYYRFYRLTTKGLDFVYSITQNESLSKGSIPKTPHYFECADLYFNCDGVSEFKREPMLSENHLSLRPDAEIHIKTPYFEKSFLIEHDRRTERLNRISDKFNQYANLLSQQQRNIIMTVSAEAKRSLMSNRYSELVSALKYIRKIRRIEKKIPSLNSDYVEKAHCEIDELLSRVNGLGYTDQDEVEIESRLKAHEEKMIKKLIDQRVDSIKDLIISMDDSIKNDDIAALMTDTSWSGNMYSFKKLLLENEFLIGSSDEVSRYLNEISAMSKTDYLNCFGVSSNTHVELSQIEFKVNSEVVKKNLDSGYFYLEGKKIAFVIFRVDVSFSDLMKYQKLQGSYIEGDFDELMISMNGNIFRY